MKIYQFRVVLTVLVAVFAVFFWAGKADAATLLNSKDTITTSRPSAAAPLSANAATTDTVINITPNLSRYLASDSAQIMRTSTSALVVGGLTVASQSAGLDKVFLTAPVGTAAQQGTDVLIAPMTARHTITFTTISAIPTNGKIILTFPGTGSNIASPSATTFSFNGLASGNITISGATGCTVTTISAPTVTLTCASGLAANSTPIITLGSTSPTLINPTKSAVAGTSDSWKIQIDTQDSASVPIDTAKVSIATIESVVVRAEVDPSITFTIAGVANGTALSSIIATYCADTTANVPDSSATEVNLGFLRNGIINLSAQQLTVSTNGSQGYVISATSSGQLINPGTGRWIRGANSDTALTANDTPAPAVFTASGTETFGISACGSRVNTTLWGASGSTTGFSSGSKYSNPFNTGANSFYATISSYTGGPVSNDSTIVKYAGSVSGTTPPGQYRTALTYVATATF